MSLTSVVLHLKEVGADMIRYSSSSKLLELELPHPSTGLPIYRVIKVYLTSIHKLKNDPVYMVFVDNGMVYYCHEDILEEFKLDPHHFTPHGDYDYEEIFSSLFLEGGQDIASFAGFFFLE